VTDNPLVSVCLPVHNDAKTVRETLDSLAAQTYPNLEIVVCDNASTDGTGAIVTGYPDARIRYHRHEANIGPFPNWNAAIRMARGEFVAVYHSDDVYHPEIVEAEARFLDAWPEAAAVLAMDEMIDPEGRKIGETRLPASLAGDRPLRFAEVFPVLLAEGNHFLRCPTFMMRRSAIDAVGLFDESLEPFRSARDLEYYLRILKRFPIGLLDRQLVRYRISAMQETAKLTFLRTGESDHHRVMDHFIADLGDAISAFPESARERYAFFRQVDTLVRAANCTLKGERGEASALLAGMSGFGAACLKRGGRLVHLAFYGLMRFGLALGAPAPFTGLVRKIVASRVGYH
jgi:glycosyltransferase involved in cell wall biosynthesis